MQSGRFRHTAQFRRLRSDKPPADCTYAKLEVVAPQDHAGEVFVRCEDALAGVHFFEEPRELFSDAVWSVIPAILCVPAPALAESAEVALRVADRALQYE